jgi:hypothetical protein
MLVVDLLQKATFRPNSTGVSSERCSWKSYQNFHHAEFGSTAEDLYVA